MSSGGWGCPHELDGTCQKVNNLPCDPGMKGCELHGRFAFFNDDKNERLRQKQAQRENGQRNETRDDANGEADRS